MRPRPVALIVAAVAAVCVAPSSFAQWSGGMWTLGQALTMVGASGLVTGLGALVIYRGLR